MSLGQLTFLVGSNGSGKSNFLDALRFVSDSLTSPLDHALRDRGGINDVRRRSSGHPTHFGIRLDFHLPSGNSGYYSFRVGAKEKGTYRVQTEQCHVFSSLEHHYFNVDNGKVETDITPAPIAAADRLYLVNASGHAAFREVYDTLAGMRFYNLNPDSIRSPQPPSAEPFLLRDGSNITTILSRIIGGSTDTLRLIEEYLNKVVPQVKSIELKNFGAFETVLFRQQVSASESLWNFYANNMSDGTLRALGILVALFQDASNDNQIPLVGIEEPETALHAGALSVVLAALDQASRKKQVLVTSHSADLLDDDRITAEQIRAVTVHNGATVISSISEAARSVLKDGLYSAGELLRSNQLRADESEIVEQASKQISLFQHATKK